MTDYPEIASRFARETSAHRMTVLHDAGLYRHLRFEAVFDQLPCSYPDTCTCAPEEAAS